MITVFAHAHIHNMSMKFEEKILIHCIMARLIFTEAGAILSLLNFYKVFYCHSTAFILVMC
jgi:hypothetical protein